MKSNHGAQQPETVPEGYFWLGQVGRPHGVKGAFFLKTEDNRSEWPGYRQLLLKTPGQADKLLTVEKAYLSGGKLAISVAGIAQREACESLYNAHLFVARGEIKKGSDEHIVGELVGCSVAVEGCEGVYGTVVAVHNFGAQETLEIQKKDSEETIYYPFLEDFILSVDEGKKWVVVKNEPAFLDDQNS
ncbi:MAG: ribosome maturation factor RimM [Silvanigrellaceae bacterium]